MGRRRWRRTAGGEVVNGGDEDGMNGGRGQLPSEGGKAINICLLVVVMVAVSSKQQRRICTETIWEGKKHMKCS